MYRDPLSQTPTYQKILAEGREEGREEGLQRAVLMLVEARFPSLTDLARQTVAKAKKPDAVEYAFKMLATVSDEDTARKALELLAA